MKVYRDIVDNNGNVTKTPIFNIMEGIYSGKDMGERSITATIEFPTPIDFHAGDYVEFDIADLIRGENVEGGHFLEKFYIYTMPTIKKVASSMSVGNAFEHTVTFYPRQYELGCMQMRDVLQQVNSGIIYTGYDEFSFYGGAKTLIDRVIAVMNERFPKTATGVAGVDYWDYRISDSVNEERNTALEKFQFDFSGNSVMDAVLKLNDENGINTKFWINERMIYIGFKRPYICGVDSANVLRTIPFDFKYGKTSHLPISTNYGNLFTITKSLGSNSPITRLYAYGADRNLHRFYCSDRIKSGRYVNHLMLPSFGNDGKTDYIDSVEGIAKFGIREGSKTFDDIYPSLRYFTYGDIRSVKYCIKIMGSGVEPDSSQYKKGKTYQYPIARVQCYKVEPLAGTKVNHLVQSAPPVDLAVFCHATGKTVKVILYAAKDGKTALQRQQEAAGKWDNGNYRVPAQTLHGTDYIAGSAFAIHDENYPCAHTHEKYTGSIGAKQQDDSGKPLTRDDWFVDADKIEIHEGEERVVNPAKEKYQNEVSIHQIHYTDTHWITDIFEFTAYDQTSFQRQGYSAYCWARINNTYPESMSDSVEVNQVVDVPAVVIPDTDLNSGNGTNQQYWEIFTRDMGFKINEQTWFGDYVFLFGNCTVNFLDGNLGGYGFTCPKENNSKKVQEIYIPALLDDGTENEAFFRKDDYVSEAQCRKAYEQGAYWRILLQRADTDIANYWMPNISVNGNAGDHFVFLDIYMPDIYQRVAERRLEKEARKYLDANDDGDIQYSFDFDKVRMIQVPAFGLQMREGAIMRVVDDDLDVKTLNSAKTIFQQTSGLVSRKTVYQTTYTESSQEKVYYTEQHRDIDYLIEQGVVKLDEKTNKILKGDSAPITHKLYFSKDPTNLVNGIHIDAPAEWIYISDEDLSDTTGEPFAPINGVNVRIVERKTENSNFAYYLTDLYLTLNAKNIRHNNSGQYLVDLSYHSQFGVLPRWYEDRDGKFLLGIVEYDMHYPHTYDETIYTPNINLRPQGSRFFCPSQQLTEFKANKYYEVTMDCENTTMPFFDKNGMRTLFALLNNLGDYASWFVPEYISEEITDFDGSDKWRRFVFKFTLEETFNDSQDYYPAIQYISDGKTEEVSVRLISVIESDAGGLKELNYADLNIDTITIKFHDNTREHGVSLQNGIEPSRRVGNAISPMIREISATVKEESRASAWAQMMSRIENNEIVGDQIIRTQEQIANAARRRYRELLALRDSIFDPDGTCDQTFLHIMMLQVGADSMNYQLDKTHQSANGNALSNCRIDRVENNNDTFSVLSEDILRHYVFTEDEPQGLWYVEKPAQAFDLAQVADDNGTLYYPTYFVAIKCAIHDSRSAVWVCEQTQHKVNEDSEYYYFNWGILNPDNEGHYTLTETRGNAYMYGDNLVCGKISTLAGQSYFDLTHGNFVLSDGTNTALSYINGILTISGVTDNIDKVLSQLEGLQDMVIGGENLYSWNDREMLIYGEDANGDEAESFRFNYFYTLETNTTAVVTAELENEDALSGVNNLYVVAIPYGTSGLTESNDVLWRDGKGNYNVVLTYLSSMKIYDLGTPIKSGSTKQLLYFFAKDSKNDLGSLYPDDGIVYARRIMVQFGTKATSYHPYTEHAVTVSNSFVKTAVQSGSTQIVGGLTLTNLLLLKNEQKEISAGMSGLSDNVTMWGGGSYEDAVKQANGLASELAKLLPVLITKEGVGSNIGCFKVISDHAIEVQGTNGDKIVIDSNDNGYPSISVVKDNNVVTKISSEVLNKKKITLKRYTKIEYTDSTRVQIYTTNGAVNSRVNVSNSTLGLSVNQLYGLTFNATNVKIYVKLYSPNNYYNLSNFKISFNLYLNNTLLSSVSETVASQNIGSAGQMIVVHTNLITSTKNITITSSGADILNIRNVSVSGQYNGKTYLVSSYLYGISFGFGISESSFVDGSIDFVNSDGVTNTIIGSNGMIVKGERGGFVQILNSENQMYFQAAGLPNDKISKDSGQMCVKNTDTSRDAFIAAFRDWAANYIQAKSGFSAALDKVLNAVPKYDSLLGIEE